MENIPDTVNAPEYPEDIVDNWGVLAKLLVPAVEKSYGELVVDDLKTLALGGRMFIFSDLERLVVTGEFLFYPKKTVFLVGFGAGVAAFRKEAHAYVSNFARRGGASCLRAYCREPNMVRYCEMYFDATRAYTVMEAAL